MHADIIQEKNLTHTK